MDFSSALCLRALRSGMASESRREAGSSLESVNAISFGEVRGDLYTTF